MAFALPWYKKNASEEFGSLGSGENRYSGLAGACGVVCAVVSYRVLRFQGQRFVMHKSLFVELVKLVASWEGVLGDYRARENRADTSRKYR